MVPFEFFFIPMRFHGHKEKAETCHGSFEQIRSTRGCDMSFITTYT